MKELSIDRNWLDYTYQDRLKCIDSIVATPNIMRYVEGSKLFEIDVIVDTDHRSYVINVNS